MEEKERYEIHIYDDICVDLYDNGVLDKSINDTYKLEDLLNQQDKRIKELEEENKKANINNYLEDYFLVEKENQQLKQQLEEKEDELNSARVGEQFALKCCNEAKEQLAEKENELKKFKNLRATPKQLQRAYQERYKYKERCNELKNQHLKDKISFALEQLEKVKENIHYLLSFDYNLVCRVNEQIDNQIVELKKEMK